MTTFSSAARCWAQMLPDRTAIIGSEGLFLRSVGAVNGTGKLDARPVPLAMGPTQLAWPDFGRFGSIITGRTNEVSIDVQTDTWIIAYLLSVGTRRDFCRPPVDTSTRRHVPEWT
jgi:hypothetical protein